VELDTQFRLSERFQPIRTREKNFSLKESDPIPDSIPDSN
jgi:hypothetical protein